MSQIIEEKEEFNEIDKITAEQFKRYKQYQQLLQTEFNSSLPHFLLDDVIISK